MNTKIQERFENYQKLRTEIINKIGEEKLLIEYLITDLQEHLITMKSDK